MAEIHFFFLFGLLAITKEAFEMCAKYHIEARSLIHRKLHLRKLTPVNFRLLLSTNISPTSL